MLRLLEGTVCLKMRQNGSSWPYSQDMKLYKAHIINNNNFLMRARIIIKQSVLYVPSMHTTIQRSFINALVYEKKKIL